MPREDWRGSDSQDRMDQGIAYGDEVNTTLSPISFSAEKGAGLDGPNQLFRIWLSCGNEGFIVAVEVGLLGGLSADA